MAAVKDLIGRLAELMVGREGGWRKKDGRHRGCVQVLVHCFWKGDGFEHVGSWLLDDVARCALGKAVRVAAKAGQVEEVEGGVTSHVRSIWEKACNLATWQRGNVTMVSRAARFMRGDNGTRPGLTGWLAGWLVD
ncbi:hypothetical protein CH63R_05553 [Colletotrichum higginsianum IMI 349063]|uniref:Uncharacterized protein n=1 Tax=Colletotrichum higginsianum (strain IMI 349063) TaxID=759273 RepID=A0A1B7YCP7_COLHI|nr:hypothetical protein CH63R_05553 [Colletotrichum higginsianum IMI 349063]OBR09861.1 hypothetical protein CH63R_05553 [Colletotrichum higginsianum IMI 349063]